MNKPIVILGATPFSSLMRCYLEKEGKEIAAYSAEAAYIKASSFDGLPTVSFEEIEKRYPPAQYRLLNTIGFVQMNRARERLYFEAVKKGYSFETFIHPSAVVNSPLGDGCIVLENSSIGFRCTIGKGCIIWSGVIIPHDCCAGNFSYWSPGAVSCGNVQVGERCFIGAHAVLKNRIQIAPECLIGAGVYMNRSCSTAGAVFAAPKAIQHEISAGGIYG